MVNRSPDEDILDMVNMIGEEEEEKKRRVKLKINKPTEINKSEQQPIKSSEGDIFKEAEESSSRLQDSLSEAREPKPIDVLEEELDVELEETEKSKVKNTKKPKKTKKPRKKAKAKKRKKPKKEVRDNPKKIKEKVGEGSIDDLITKKYRDMKMKKILTSFIIITVLIALVIFGTYNTFFKVEKSPGQIAAEVNSINRTTAFPTDGVEGFLKQNITNMLDSNIYMTKGTKEFSIVPSELYITNISKRSAYIANVYFTAKAKTNQGENYHNFFVALSYDYESYSYSPASEVRITPIIPQDSIKIVDNEFLSFDGISKESSVNVEKAQTFIENFLMMMYNDGVDISPYYEGPDSLGDPNAKFVRVEKFDYYQGYNKNGYNAKVVYILHLNEGVEIKVTNYIDILPSDKSFIINAIL